MGNSSPQKQINVEDVNIDQDTSDLNNFNKSQSKHIISRNTSNQEKNRISPLQKDLQIISERCDAHYGGDIKILENKNQDTMLYALKSITCTSKETLENLKDETLKRIQLSKNQDNQFVTQIIDSRVLEDDSFCGHQYIFQFLVEYHSLDLQMDIMSRIQNNRKLYSESQILTMIYNVAAGLKYFEQQDIYHGGISPKNIFCLPEQTFKIFDVQYLTGSTSYTKLILNIDTEMYISPELYGTYNKHVLDPFTQNKGMNLSKSEVFSLGLVALQMALLIDSVQQIYVSEEQQSISSSSENLIHENYIRKKLELIQKRYSTDLAYIIAQMLEINPDIRWDIEQTMYNLSMYQNQMFMSQQRSLYDNNNNNKNFLESDEISIFSDTRQEIENEKIRQEIAFSNQIRQEKFIQEVSQRQQIPPEIVYQSLQQSNQQLYQTQPQVYQNYSDQNQQLYKTQQQSPVKQLQQQQQLSQIYNKEGYYNPLTAKPFQIHQESLQQIPSESKLNCDNLGNHLGQNNGQIINATNLPEKESQNNQPIVQAKQNQISVHTNQSQISYGRTDSLNLNDPSPRPMNKNDLVAIWETQNEQSPAKQENQTIQQQQEQQQKNETQQQQQQSIRQQNQQIIQQPTAESQNSQKHNYNKDNQVLKQQQEDDLAQLLEQQQKQQEQQQQENQQFEQQQQLQQQQEIIQDQNTALKTSLKHVDKIVKDAIGKSAETKQKYNEDLQQNQQQQQSLILQQQQGQDIKKNSDTEQENQKAPSQNQIVIQSDAKIVDIEEFGDINEQVEGSQLQQNQQNQKCNNNQQQQDIKNIQVNSNQKSEKMLSSKEIIDIKEQEYQQQKLLQDQQQKQELQENTEQQQQQQFKLTKDQHMEQIEEYKNFINKNNNSGSKSKQQSSTKIKNNDEELQSKSIRSSQQSKKKSIRYSVNKSNNNINNSIELQSNNNNEQKSNISANSRQQLSQTSQLKKSVTDIKKNIIQNQQKNIGNRTNLVQSQVPQKSQQSQKQQLQNQKNTDNRRSLQIQPNNFNNNTTPQNRTNNRANSFRYQVANKETPANTNN